MSSLTIRKYQSADKEACRTLWKELTEWHREIYQDQTIGGAHPEEHFDKYLAEIGSDRLWVAVHDSQVVGFIGLIVKGEEAQIEPLVVTKAYRRRGIGTQLIRKVFEEARNVGVRFLSIRPVARNAEAIRFLHKQGFRNIGQVELFSDLSDHRWKPGPRLFGHEFNF